MKFAQGWIVTAGFAVVAAFAASPVARAEVLFSCTLDRSFTLVISQQEPSDGGPGVELVLERKHFLGSQGYQRLIVRDPSLIVDSQVILAFKDQGKEGYFLLRAERGVEPSVLIDNSLMDSIGTMFFTSGRLMPLPDCVSGF